MSSASPLSNILTTYRQTAQTEREKGTYFEELIACYLRNEASYKDLYSDVWTYAQWAETQGIDKRDTGIDLVAKTRGTNEYHAIQCKLYAEDYKLQKSDIDSFFTASGKKPFTHRLIVCTTNLWTEHAESALLNQQPPVSKIDLNDLENSQIDWSAYTPKQAPKLKPKKQLREHQMAALKSVKAGLTAADRGKLIMACGTGKTFTSLKIAEEIAGKGGHVLFLVPSLALLSQTLTEWTQESSTPLHSFAVCSDSEVGKPRKKGDDLVQTFAHELRYPATTNAKHLADEMAKRHDSAHMSVVFSTYHSIDTISEAQQHYSLPDFDLIVCDEAHRTTGVTFEDEEESNFVKVHNNDFIKARKRLYMTATPRIYSDAAHAQAELERATPYSMNNEEWYGKQLFVITFSEAVKRELLVDYKVIVLAVEESHVSRRIQSLLKDENNQLKVHDAAKIIGCWKALSKQDLSQDLIDDKEPMRRAVAFCQVIEIANKGKIHKVSSKQIASIFDEVIEAYKESATEEEHIPTLQCEAAHVDGGMNASEKETKLNWLKSEVPNDTCRILSNVRCLSEGVDVPALDAVLFLTPRNSQVDVVQSVGRVMRNAPNKKRGYVILPVVIPAGVEPHVALNDNKTYAVVWQVLQALRSHDDRFDAMINKLDLIGKDTSKMEVVAITDKIQKKAAQKDTTKRNAAIAGGSYGIGATPAPKPVQHELQFEIGEIERAIYAKLVQKCGNRHHWADWANDIAKIARTHIDRITGILENKDNTSEREAFNAFAAELRDDLNDSITDAEIVEMLAQHLITKPVFDALFADYSFAQHNPMSQAMQAVLDLLNEHRLDKEADTLQTFYDSVKMQADGISNPEAKQKILVKLYDNFFKNAFPKMSKRWGIVYTPVEVVDFIIHSVNDVLKTEFGQTLGSKGVHIIDPFTGTGTFITRLLQSGLIKPEELAHKYKHEIHANELVLLAYYIASINIEAVYHSLAGGSYQPFEGICLTDTFQMYEKEDMIDALLADNSTRRKRQKQLDIRVIIGNPPYTEGQESENDDNKKLAYPFLDERIRSTYASKATATLTKGLYNSYIRAIRWASDRIGQSGVIGFITSSGFIVSNTASGLRKTLAEEFANIHIINLRGDIRKNMLSKGRAKEGQNIFASGSMTGIAITLFVKNPNATQTGQIFYHDIGDDLTTDEKKQKLTSFASVAGITKAAGWQTLTPDAHGDWLRQRDDGFAQFIPLGDKEKGATHKIFDNFSQGVLTARDSWCYNASKAKVAANMQSMVAFYNAERERFNAAHPTLDKKGREAALEGFINTDPTKISWTHNIKEALIANKSYVFVSSCVTPSLYRPFTKSYLYFNRHFNERVYQMPRIFPYAKAENLVIMVKARWFDGQIALMTNSLLGFTPDGGEQCFPLYLYDAPEDAGGTLFGAAPTTPKRRDAITDAGLAHFTSLYPAESITKEDLFYYIYGLLHSPQYRDKYADNLSKELPRIPRVKSAADFWAFSKAGRALAKLHVDYEQATPYPATLTGDKAGNYRVEKMKYGKKGGVKDLSTIHYNNAITISNIPLEAYDYVVNGKPAIDWVIDRQCVKPDKDSGIVNDANDWATETMGNPRYPLDLLLRVITVSLETMKIVKTLPKLDEVV